MNEPKQKYYRWHPATPDPTGTMRGASADQYQAINERTMLILHEQAILEQLARKLTP